MRRFYHWRFGGFKFMIDILKEYYQSYKVPILIGTFFLLLIIVFLIGKHSAVETKKEQAPTIISQDLLESNNVLQNKLDISEQNAKLLQDKIDKVQAGKIQPATTYYVQAPNVIKGAEVVQEKIKEKDPTLPPAVLAKSDRTVVTPITKDGSGNDLATDKQKVDVYKIDLRKDHRIKAGVTVIDSTIYNTVGYEQGRVEVLAQAKGTNLKGGSVLYNVIEW